MRIPRPIALVRFLGVAFLSLIACTSSPPAPPVPTAAAPVAPSTAVPVAPTPTFERVREAEPTVGAPAKPTVAPPTPTTAAVQAHGLLTWRDDTLRSDGVLVSVEDLPSLSGDLVYGAWLNGAGGNLFLGTLDAPAPGTQGTVRSLTFVAPDHANLPADYESVIVTRAPKASVGTSPTSDVVVSGKLPPQALAHLRHLLVHFDGTPDQIGFAIGLRQESDKVLQHAQFLQDAVNESNLANVRFHAEHLVNMIEGKEGEHFGDLDGDGKIDNPGDGFGLLENGGQLGYIKGMQDHAQLAAAAPDATESIKLHATNVQITGDNTRIRLIDIRDRALQVSTVRRAADARENAQRILALAHQTIDGVDLDGDGLISPVPGEGGVLTAYQHAQLMAGIPLAPGTASGAGAAAPTIAPTIVPALAPTVAIFGAAPTVAPTAAPTAAPTLAPTLAPTRAPTFAPTLAPTSSTGGQVAPSRIELAISDDAFAPKTITIPVGATVVWSRSGSHTHTVTADDSSFDSGFLRAGQGFEHAFTQPGTFAYYCDVHGGPGGVGMSGAVTVSP